MRATVDLLGVEPSTGGLDNDRMADAADPEQRLPLSEARDASPRKRRVGRPRGKVTHPWRPRNPDLELTATHLRVIDLIIAGHGHAAIARSLDISESTVNYVKQRAESDLFDHQPVKLAMYRAKQLYELALMKSSIFLRAIGEHKAGAEPSVPLLSTILAIQQREARLIGMDLEPMLGPPPNVTLSPTVVWNLGALTDDELSVLERLQLKLQGQLSGAIDAIEASATALPDPPPPPAATPPSPDVNGPQ
jgi:hypothetical protein